MTHLNTFLKVICQQTVLTDTISQIRITFSYGLIILILLFLNGCDSGNKIEREFLFEDESFQITAMLKNYKKSEHHLGYSVLLYADIHVKNLRDTPMKFDLNDLRLNIDSIYSNSIFIDSIGDVIITEKKLQADEVINFSVYWSFLNQTPDLISKNVELIY